jgi:hypothetical protein
MVPPDPGVDARCQSEYKHAMRLFAAVALLACASPAFAGPTPTDWKTACTALFSSAKNELAKLDPMFAKAKLRAELGSPSLTYQRKASGEISEDFAAGVHPRLGLDRTGWYDPGCGETCPSLIFQKETIGHDGYYYITVTGQDENTQARFGEIMRKTIDACIALPPNPALFAAGFWKPLVVAGARWELTDPMKRGTVVVETYDARKVGTADVARLRWTYTDSTGQKRDVGDSNKGRYTQLAVTVAGLYLLDADQNDASVADSLTKKPSRSDPPRAYAGSAKNEGRFLELIESPWGPVACMGTGPTTEVAKRAELGLLCVSPKAGIVRLHGIWSPTGDVVVNKAAEK